MARKSWDLSGQFDCCLDKLAEATGCQQERKRTSVNTSDMGHEGVRAGQRTTVRKTLYG